MSTDHQDTSPDNTDGSKSHPTQSKKSQAKKPKAGSSKKMTDKEQSARFIETARELESDESGVSFERFMKSLSRE